MTDFVLSAFSCQAATSPRSTPTSSTGYNSRISQPHRPMKVILTTTASMTQHHQREASIQQLTSLTAMTTPITVKPTAVLMHNAFSKVLVRLATTSVSVLMDILSLMVLAQTFVDQTSVMGIYRRALLLDAQMTVTTTIQETSRVTGGSGSLLE